MTSQHPRLEALIATMAILRGEGGCPWDAEQTHESLVPYLLEEVFELIEALESGSRENIREELGDVLYQLLFHADIAAHDSSAPFDIDDVAGAVDAKMRRRHPHVFDDGDASSVDEVVARWETIKAEEKNHRSSALEGIPDKLPALARASSVLKRSKDVREAPTHPSVAEMTSDEELGDYLLAIVAMARSRGLNPESALRDATRKFETLVRDVEAASGLAPGDTGA